MTSVLFDFESGSNGTTATNVNTGLDTVTAGANTAITFATAAASTGSLGLRVASTSTGTGTATLRINTLQGGVTGSSVRCALDIGLSATPSAAFQVEYWTDSPNAALLPRVIINTDRTVSVQNAGNTTIFTTATAIPTSGTKYRIELVWKPGTTTTNGTIGFGLALATGAINSAGSDYFYATNVNTGTSDGVGRWNIGKLSAGAYVGNIDLDNLRADDTTFTSDPATWLGSSAPDLSITGSTALLGAFTPNGLAAFDTTVTGATALLGLVAPAGSATVSASITGATSLLGLQVPTGGLVSLAGDVTVQGATPLLGLLAPSGTAVSGIAIDGATALLGLLTDGGTYTTGADIAGATALLGLLAPAGTVQGDATRQGATPLLGFFAPDGRGFVGYKLGVWTGAQWKPVATAVWGGTQWLHPEVTVTAP